MWKNLVWGTLFLLFLSCQSTQPSMVPEWVDTIAEEEGQVFILYNGPDFNNDADLFEALAESILDQMGIPFSDSHSDLYQQWSLFLQQAIEDSNPGIAIERRENYMNQSKTYIALLLSIEEVLYRELQQEWVAQLIEPNEDLLAWETRGDSLKEQGDFASAFLAYAEALQLSQSLNNEGSEYHIRYYRSLALESLSSMTLSDIQAPDEVYSGENFSAPFLLRVSMDPELNESMLFRVSYPHPMNPTSLAEAKVWTDMMGELTFLHPPVFEEGRYSLRITPDRDFLKERLGLDEGENASELDRILTGLIKEKSYRVKMDKKRIPLMLLLEDRDILGKTVEGRESSRKLQVLLESRGIKVQALSPDIQSQGVSERQLLRDVLLEANDPNSLLLIGNTRISDFQSSQNRVSISGELQYRLLDLRTFKVLDQGIVKKQLDFDNATAALSGLYTQLTRELAAVFAQDN